MVFEDLLGSAKSFRPESGNHVIGSSLGLTSRVETRGLSIAFDLTNQSRSPIFLTAMGPHINMALDVSTDNAGENGLADWLNIYGTTDIKSWEADSLAPGATIHGKFCLGSSVWVVNLAKQTRRVIPVRGSLRVDVSYFSTEESWRMNEEWHTHHPGKLIPPVEIAPKWAKIYAEIPCLEKVCESNCLKPPKGIHGEARPVPDVFYLDPQWNERGKKVTDGLAAKFPSCRTPAAHLI